MRYWLCIEDVNAICKGTVCESKNGSIKADGFYICDIGSEMEEKNFVEVTNKRYEVIDDVVCYDDDDNLPTKKYKTGCVLYFVTTKNKFINTYAFYDSMLNFVAYGSKEAVQSHLRLIVDDKESLQVPVYGWMKQATAELGEKVLLLPVSGGKTIAVDVEGKFYCYMDSAVGRHIHEDECTENETPPVAAKAPAGKFESAGREIGALVDTKQAQYGDAISAVDDIMAILYPNGIPKEKMRDMLLIVRMLDKICRLSLGNGEGGESPFKDISGYGLLGAKHVNNGGKNNE